MYHEEDLLPLSGLQRLVYCERQAALVHIEHLWAETADTVYGLHRHRRVHDEGPRRERRGDLILVRGLWVQSLELGVVGRVDVVEFHRMAKSCRARRGCQHEAGGCKLNGVGGFWRPFPVEFKVGGPKSHRADEVQLCAQALCLEEGLQVEVPEGALFYGRTRRRHPVVFDETLRDLTRQVASRLHDLVRSGYTPPPEYGARCRLCSLRPLCIPKLRRGRRTARGYLDQELCRALAEGDER